jgi:hypothetical protein
MSTYEKTIEQARVFLARYIWIGVLVALFGILWYYRSQINKKDSNITIMEKAYNNSDLAPQLSSVNTADPKYNQPLLNFYVASSYNSCCAGDFQDSYVSLEPLEQIIFHGARVLDFEIYSMDGKPVVGASSTPNVNIKGTYNSIPVDDVLRRVSQLAFSSAKCANPNDPLFLHFRIKSNRKDIYPQLSSAIMENFAGRLMDARYSYEGRKMDDGETENLTLVPLKELEGKVIIMAHQENDNYKETGNSFYELVNLGSNSIYFRQLRNHDVQYAPDADALKSNNKISIALTMPDWSELNNNVPIVMHQAMGCQMVCMNYQNLDRNMKYYLKFFNDEGSAFVPKPAYLCKQKQNISCPTPPDKSLSFKAKSYSLPMISFKM